jgi:hypothetical protein
MKFPFAKAIACIPWRFTANGTEADGRRFIGYSARVWRAECSI